MTSHIFEEDNYLPCETYAQYPHQEDGISRFFHEENGQWYFAYFRHDKVFLRSEGYTNEPARENGVSSVLKNFGEDEHYLVSQTPDGKWVLRLRAANNKEIACSCSYDSEAEARSHLPEKEAHPAHDDDYLSCSEYEGHETMPDHPHMAKFRHKDEYLFVMYNPDGSIRLRSERYTSENGRDNGFDSVIKNQHEDSHYSIDEKFNHFFLILKAASHQEIARSCPYDSEAEAKKQLPSALKGGQHDDDYLPGSAYEGHPTDADHSDMAKFSKDGEFLFVVYNSEGNVLLRSERYPTEAARDKGFDSVVKNRDSDDQYTIEEKVHRYFLVLKAANHHEIARSLGFRIGASGCLLFAQRHQAARAAKNEANKLQHDDNYLACTHYETRPRSQENSEFCVFIHNEEYYFGLYDHHGDVLLRSEGYSSAAARDNGIASVIKNRGNKDRYEVVEFHGAHFVKLHAANGKEIARSCPSDESEALALIALLTQAAAADPEPVPVAAVADVPEKKGFNWWWLILLLFALVLAALWMRGCSDSADSTAAAAIECQLQPILFDFDSEAIPMTGQLELEEMAELLVDNPGYTARIEAYTDSIGTYEYNKDLSKRRCDAAMTILTGAGVEASRITVDPEAYLEPIAKNTPDDSGRHFNRRVELMVFDAEGNTVCSRQPLDIPENLRLD